ncbi:hypothetical protein [Lacimicrobium sp. SS2-24]|nr:hypothetical protein [Lacimicrobium sp. SS2-24]
MNKAYRVVAVVIVLGADIGMVMANYLGSLFGKKDAIKPRSF